MHLMLDQFHSFIFKHHKYEIIRFHEIRNSLNEKLVAYRNQIVVALGQQQQKHTEFVWNVGHVWIAR